MSAVLVDQLVPAFAANDAAQQPGDAFSSKLHSSVTAALWQRAAGHGESAASAMRLRMSRLEQTRPGLQNVLRAHRIGDNAMVASLLIQQAERYHARKR